MLSPKGLTMADDIVKTIQDWPKPQKVKDIQSFSLASPISIVVLFMATCYDVTPSQLRYLLQLQ